MPWYFIVERSPKTSLTRNGIILCSLLGGLSQNVRWGKQTTPKCWNTSVTGTVLSLAEVANLSSLSPWKHRKKFTHKKFWSRKAVAQHKTFKFQTVRCASDRWRFTQTFVRFFTPEKVHISAIVRGIFSRSRRTIQALSLD